MMTHNPELLYSIYKRMKDEDDETTITEVAKVYCADMNFEYKDSIRRYCSNLINNSETNQYEGVERLSAVKADGTIMTVEEYCDYYKIPSEQIKSYKLVTHGGKNAYYNLASFTLDAGEQEDFSKKLIAQLKEFSPKFVPLQRYRETEGHLLVIDPCDIHLGKLASAFETGEDYNNQIAVQRVLDGVRGIVNKASGYPIDKILFIGGNDILHIDTPKRTTTAGTPQDTDGMWYDNFLMAKQLYVDVLEMLIPVADVHFVYNPSNHDYTNGFFLADVIQTYYRNCKNITFDCSIAHRKYFTYHDNLIGTTHGDGAKIENLPLLMAQESPQWSATKHRYVYTHHVHHKTSKDFIGITVESMRTVTGTDSWHSRNGYQHSPKAVEGFIHHKKHGQIARLTHIF